MVGKFAERAKLNISQCQSRQLHENSLRMCGRCIYRIKICTGCCLLLVGRAKRADALLDWETVSTKLPWCAIFVLGGGLALSKGLEVRSYVTYFRFY